jgi:hypothetical protein
MTNSIGHIDVRCVMQARPGGSGPVGYINDIYCRPGPPPELPPDLIYPVGQILSRDAYPELYAVIGEVYSEGKFYQLKRRWRHRQLRRRRLFRVPDFRGRVVVTVDPGKE